MITEEVDVVCDAHAVNYNCSSWNLFLNMRAMCYEDSAFQRQLSTDFGDRQKQRRWITFKMAYCLQTYNFVKMLHRNY